VILAGINSDQPFKSGIKGDQSVTALEKLSMNVPLQVMIVGVIAAIMAVALINIRAVQIDYSYVSS
jgi:hypothetical protein